MPDEIKTCFAGLHYANTLLGHWYRGLRVKAWPDTEQCAVTATVANSLTCMPVAAIAADALTPPAALKICDPLIAMAALVATAAVPVKVSVPAAASAVDAATAPTPRLSALTPVPEMAACAATEAAVKLTFHVRITWPA